MISFGTNSYRDFQVKGYITIDTPYGGMPPYVI